MRPLPARESRIETRECLPPERWVETNPRAERNELATDRPSARMDRDVVSSATLSKCSTPGMVQTRPASENSVARPEGWAVLEDRPPLQPSRCPRGTWRDFCRPGLRFLLLSSAETSASDAGKSSSQDTGFGRGSVVEPR